MGNIWKALQGMGAGFQGRGVEWQRNEIWRQQQERERQQAEQDRMRKASNAAMVRAVAEADALAETDMPAAIAVIQGVVDQFPGTPEAQRLEQMLQSPDFAARAGVEVDVLQRVGVLKAPQQVRPNIRAGSDGNMYDFSSGTAQMIPGAPDGVTFAQGSGPTINIGDETRNYAAEAYARAEAAKIEEILKKGNEAIDQLKIMRPMARMKVKTGFGKEGLANIARVAEFVLPGAGELFSDQMEEVEVFRALSGTLLNERLMAASGIATDHDAMRVGQTLPNLGNTEAANDFLLSYMMALQERYLERADHYRRRKREMGEALDVDQIDREWRQYINDVPLLSTTERVRGTTVPLNFYQFKRKYQDANPDKDNATMLAAWRVVAGN